MRNPFSGGGGCCLAVARPVDGRLTCVFCCSRQAIKKYILANNNLGATTDAAYNTHLSRALSSGEQQGVFSRPKGMFCCLSSPKLLLTIHPGPSGPVKLAKKGDKAAAPKKAATTTTKKATAPKVSSHQSNPPPG